MSTFITTGDYLPQIRQYNMEDLIDDNPTVVDTAEETAIQMVKDHIYQFYDVDVVFSQVGASRHKTVLQWCINITLYLVYERIADVMKPQSVIDNYKATMEWLKSVAGGELGVQGLPEITDPNTGSAITVFRWGSNKKRK